MIFYGLMCMLWFRDGVQWLSEHLSVRWIAIVPRCRFSVFSNLLQLYWLISASSLIECVLTIEIGWMENPQPLGPSTPQVWDPFSLWSGCIDLKTSAFGEDSLSQQSQASCFSFLSHCVAYGGLCAVTGAALCSTLIVLSGTFLINRPRVSLMACFSCDGCLKAVSCGYRSNVAAISQM